MNLPRRVFLRLAASAAVLPAVPRIVLAQSYPSRPVHLVVGFAAGSASDILARLIGDRLSQTLGHPFVIENRGGAGGTVGAEMAARAPADGYTLLVSGSADAVTATLYDKLNYSFLRDLAPIAGIALSPLVLVVPPSFPAKTIPEFIAYAKANPHKINYGSAGVGSVAHMAGALFESDAKVQMVHVPYRGLAPALTDLMGGRLQAVFSTMPPAVAHVKAGRLRALAVTSVARSDAFPDLPTIGDSLPGYEASITEGLSAPKGVPAAVVNILNKEVTTAIADPQIKAKLAALGTVPAPMAPGDYGNYLAKETEKWAKVIKAADLKPAKG
jgi:tripartite-type tricarboxylate transporter receptor subunit TctC